MKKIISYTLISVFMFTALLAKANDVNVDINTNNSEMVTVRIDNAENNEAITIIDENGKVLYYTNNLETGTVKNLDFSIVPDGRYFIKIENDKAVKAISIEKDTHNLSISNESPLLLKPAFVKAGINRMNICYMNAQKVNISVNIYDSNGELVQTISGNDLQFEKTLDFSKVPKGEYKIVFESPLLNQAFSTTFENK